MEKKNQRKIMGQPKLYVAAAGGTHLVTNWPLRRIGSRGEGGHARSVPSDPRVKQELPTCRADPFPRLGRGNRDQMRTSRVVVLKYGRAHFGFFCSLVNWKPFPEPVFVFTFSFSFSFFPFSLYIFSFFHLHNILN